VFTGPDFANLQFKEGTTDTLGRSLGRGFKVTPTEGVAQYIYNFCFDHVVNPKFLNKFCDHHDI